MVVATMSPKEKRRLKLLIKELKSYKALHTEYVSVYVPAGYDLNKINSHLSDELGTASNIKSSATRKNVQGALDKMLQTLKLFKKTPPNGLALFAGNIASKEGKQDMRSWYIEPTVPLNIRIYRCDKAFLTEHLEDILVVKRAYGLVVLDRRDADIALLKGKTIVHLQKTHSEVPGKTKAGGQCQMFGTLVQSSTGTIPKIEDCDTSMTVKSANFDKITIKDSQILDKWTVPKKKVYKITTKYPQLVTECSAEHVLFVLTMG